MERQLIILAGGKGTRLKSRLGDLPKPMIPFAGKPLLDHLVRLAVHHGFDDVVLFIHHRAEVIREHFKDGTGFGVSLRYEVESQPLGTAGAVLAGLDSLAEQFVVLYGDTMVNVDLKRVVAAHQESGAAATLLLHPNDHPLDSDLVEVDDQSRVTAFHNRPHPEGVWYQNLVNAGLYVLNRDALEHVRARFDLDSGKVVDFGKDVFPAMLEEGLELLGYNSPEFIKDIGTPERYDRISRQLADGHVSRSSLEHRQRAVFLDRDGTLIEDKDNLRSPEGLALFPEAGRAVQMLNQHGWRAVLVTNQPVVAKGWCTEAGLQEIHNKLEMKLGEEHAFLDRIYYCPHHPDAGFEGERPELKISCECRKPGTGMIEQAVADLNIDVEQSWLIGDTTTDFATARRAGLSCIGVKTGAGGQDGKYDDQPDYFSANVLEAVESILVNRKP